MGNKMKSIGFNKDELKEKFDKFYQEGKEWRFNKLDKLYIAKKNAIEPYLKKSKIIADLGCAEGNFLCSILKDDNIINKYLIGVDVSEYAIKMAKEKQCYDELYVGYIDDIENYTKKTKKFDFVLLNEVLYYIDNYIETLKKILFLQSKYIFISLAMGPQFFNNSDAKNIENLLNLNGYKLNQKIIYDMGYKFGIPIRFLAKLYEIFRGVKLKQTHKKIYIYEKN